MESKVNQCDIQCPLTAMYNYDYEQRNQKRGAIAKARATVTLGIMGVQQMGYASGQCPQRQLKEQDWDPSSRCAALSRDIAAKLGQPIVASSLNEHQQRVFPPAGIEIIDDTTPVQDAPPADTPPNPEV